MLNPRPLSLIVVLFILLYGFIPDAQAQVPQRLAYQSLVTNLAGDLVDDGPYKVTFRLYDHEQGSTQALWTETQTVAVEDGLLSTMIGAEQALALPFDRPYFLSVEIDGQPESRRMALSSAAYALVARDVPDSTVVRSISGLKDDVEFVAGDGISIQQRDNQLIISAAGLKGYGPAETKSTAVMPEAPRKHIDDLSQAEDDAYLNELAAAQGPGGSNAGLDLAYDGGRIITMDDGQIAINRPGAGFAAQSGILMRNGDMRLRDDASAVNIAYRLESALQDWRMNLNGTGVLRFQNFTDSRIPFQIAKGAPDTLLTLKGSGVGINGFTSMSAVATSVPTLMIENTGAGDGVKVTMAGDEGVFVEMAGSPAGPPVSTSDLPGDPTAGFEIAGAEDFGLFVGVSRTGTYVNKATEDAHEVKEAGRHGVNVVMADSAGLKVGIADKGVSIGFAGDTGVEVKKASGDGVRIIDADFDGVEVVMAGEDGLKVGTAGRDGVHIDGATRDGIHVVMGAAGALAGFFGGDVDVSGDLDVIGTLTKGGGSFKIDHPLDPQNRTLSHSFVESPDMMNVYNGNVVLNDRGEATVELPSYFEALNRDFRYQLTAIGGPGPNLYVAEKIKGNVFKIAGGASGLEVSWQVTGIRHDAWARQHKIPVEEMKPLEERGTYMHPAAHGVAQKPSRTPRSDR